MQRTFVYKDEKSNKFWSIDVDGSSYTVMYGKVGTDGQTSEKTFETAEACRKAADKVIAEKTGKGYIEEADETVEVNVLPPQITKLRELKSYQLPAAVLDIRPLSNGSAAIQLKRQMDGDKKFYELIFCNADGIQKSIRHYPVKTLDLPKVVDDHVYLPSDDSVFKYDASGKEVAKFSLAGEHARKLIIGSGDAIYAYNGCEIRRIRDGRAETVSKRDVPVPFLTMLDTGDIAFVDTSGGDGFKLVILDPDGNEKWRTKLKGSSAWRPEAFSGGRLFCVGGDAINLVDTVAKTCHSKKLSADVISRAPVLFGEHLVYASKDDTVSIVTWRAKDVVSVLRSEMDDESEYITIACDGASLFVPGAGNKVYRVAADGSCTGLAELPNPLGNDKEIAALSDGTLIIVDGENKIHFVPDNAFKPADLPKGPEFLVEDAKRLEKHFAPWAVTPACKGIVKDLLARLIGVSESDGALTLTFLPGRNSYHDEECMVYFDAPAPGKMPENMPPSFHKAVELHGGVCYDNGDAAGFMWDCANMNDCCFDYWEEDDDQERYSAIAFAGQNWYFIDRKKKNKLGEPQIILVSHEGGIDDAETFNGDLQKKTAYGLPGFTWRVLAYEILDEKDPRLKDCGMG